MSTRGRISLPLSNAQQPFIGRVLCWLWHLIPSSIRRTTKFVCYTGLRCLAVFKEWFILAPCRKVFVFLRQMCFPVQLVWQTLRSCIDRFRKRDPERKNDCQYKLLSQHDEDQNLARNKDLIKQLQESENEKNEALRDRDAVLKKKLALEDKLRASEKAKDEALTRLSEHVSLKINDNNPNIADLSDINRPTNLAEKFSTLYDDEWTEAFEVLSKKPGFGEEAKAIEFLLEIVKECFNVCREESYNQLQKLLDAYKSTIDTAPKELVKMNKDIRKKYADVYFQEVLQKICSDLKTSNEEIMQDAAIQAFVNRCTELCWLMAVQDPPMSLFSDVSSDRLFDKTKYRDYMKSGKYVEFVVWPCVLIQDGGSLMSKGIAQGQPTLATETIVNIDE